MSNQPRTDCEQAASTGGGGAKATSAKLVYSFRPTRELAVDLAAALNATGCGSSKLIALCIQRALPAVVTALIEQQQRAAAEYFSKLK